METQKPDGPSALAWVAAALTGTLVIVPLVYVILVALAMDGETSEAELVADAAPMSEQVRTLSVTPDWYIFDWAATDESGVITRVWRVAAVEVVRSD